ncbi:uncharacterized protein K441DRAFT_650281 [Cenococcum geophilum 1.58]|uniref:uncharacterized protein n=1 Tax=Cenococcum geophilum 1.58 TaxID=794803 RepID=UPI0035901C57|nr:hypothetical protein K441DRAFT_650281 [Cenococcum geophilum 1.58]
MACTLLLPILNEHVTALRHVTAPRFDLMARILLLHEHEHEHEHGSWYLTTVLPTCTHCPTYRQALLRYAYEAESVAGIVLLPTRTDKPHPQTRRLHCTAA